MPRLRGNGLANIRQWTVDHYGDEGWAAVVSSLGPSERETLRELRVADWYPLSLQAALLRAIDRRFGDDDLRLARRIGGDQAARDLDRGVTTWLFRLFSPATMLGNMDVVWRRFHDTGRWAARLDGPAVVVTVHGWRNEDRANCADVEGYLEHLARRLSRAQGHMRHTRCRLDGHEGCEFVYSEPLDRRVPMPRGPLTAETAAAVGRELMQVRDPETVRDAVVTVLRHALPRASSAALWAWDDATGEARLLWSCGHPTDRPAHCVVLEAGGRTVARVEVDALPQPEREGVLAALEALAPWFGAALAGSHGSRPSEPSAEPGGGGRVVRAAAAWRLTPRQGEVLEGVLAGLTNKEIASRIRCAEATVEVHMTALFRKSGATTRAGLVSAALGG